MDQGQRESQKGGVSWWCLIKERPQTKISLNNWKYLKFFLTLMENFNYASICWEDGVMGHKQSRFMECMEDNFLMQVLNNLTRRDALLDSWVGINCQSIAALTAGAVRCWSLRSWRQRGKQGHKTSAGRRDWSHVRLPLKVRQLIRAGQTSVTTCSKCKKNIWRAEEQAGMAGGQIAEQETLDLTQMQKGNGSRNGLLRRNSEILLGYVKTEWGRSKPVWSQNWRGTWRTTTKGSILLSATQKRPGKMWVYYWVVAFVCRTWIRLRCSIFSLPQALHSESALRPPGHLLVSRAKSGEERCYMQ